MGWRISFGVGPLRYSAPLRRPAGERLPRDYRDTDRYQRTYKADRIAMLVAGLVVGAVLIFVIVMALIG
jgi:hypothetical protein